MNGGSEPADRRIHRETLSRISDALIKLNAEFECLYCNEKAAELLGVPEGELVGSDVWELFPDAVGTVAQTTLESATATGEQQSYERYNEATGKWFEVRVYPDEDGLTVLFSDITERRERRRELERYEYIVENLPIAIGLNTASTAGEFDYVNEGFVEMFDAGSAAAVSDHTPDEIYPDDASRAEMGDELAEEGWIQARELPLQTFDGERFWGSMSANVTEIDGEEHYLGIVQDVTERKEFEQRLNALHEATREMMTAETPEAVAAVMSDVALELLDLPLNGVHLYDEAAGGLAPVAVADGLRELFGEAPVLDAGVAWEVYETGEPQVYADVRDAAAVYNPATPIRTEILLPLGDHGVFITSSTEVDAFGERELTLVKILASNAEAVLSQLETEQLLREREAVLESNREFLRETQETVSVGGWEVELPSRTLRWTDEMYRIYGLPEETEVTVERAIEQVHEADRDRLEAAFERLVETGEPYDMELRLVRPDDEVRWVRTLGSATTDDHGDIETVRGVLQDITAQKCRERELREKTRAIEEAPLGITLTDPSAEDNPLTYVNDAFLETTGYDESEVLGRNCRFLQGEGTDEEPVAQMRSAIAAGESVTVELQNYRKDGTPFWNQVKIAPVTDESGTITNYVGFQQDITTQWRYEQRLRAQRDNLELLTEMVSHDLTNSLQPVQGFTEELLDGHVDDTGRAYAERVLENTEQAISLLQTGRDLTEVMLQTEATTEPVALKRTLEPELSNVRASHTNAVVTTEGPVPAVAVTADDMLGSVFRNLLENAVVHNDKSVPEVTVSVTAMADTVRVSVADNGPGIPDARKDEVFGHGERGLDSDGTGLGLYLVDSLVSRYGGGVTVEDPPAGEGTVVTVSLPRA